MKAHELATQLLSMPDVEVRYVVYDTEFDLRWTVPVGGLNLDRVRVNDQQVIIFETKSDYSLCKKEQFNPIEDFNIIDIRFFYKDTDAPVERLNETADYCFVFSLFALFEGHRQYDDTNFVDQENMDVVLTIGYDPETWKPIQKRLSVEDAQRYVEDNYTVIREGEYPDIWYDLVEKHNV
jgi:hypothetical protein